VPLRAEEEGMNVWLTGHSEGIDGDKQKAMKEVLLAVRPLGCNGGITILYNTLILLLQKLDISKDGAVKSFSEVWDLQANHTTESKEAGH
jgi:hypothetical protein